MFIRRWCMKHPKIVIPALLVLVVLMFMVGGSPDQSLTGMPKILAIVGVFVCLALVYWFWVRLELKEGDDVKFLREDRKRREFLDRFDKQTWPHHGKDQECIEPFEKYH